MDAAPPFTMLGPDALRIRQGGGCLALFGVPFLLAGIFLVLIGLGVVPVSNAGELPRWAPTALVLMGAAFTAAGGGLALGRRWITLDRVGGRVLLQRGLLLPLTQEERSLSFYNAVAVELVPGDSDSGPSYRVVLKGWGGVADLTVVAGAPYGTAWDQARRLSDFLGCPLVDHATVHPQRFGPGEADRPIGERTLAPEEAEAPPPPVLRCEVELAGGVLRIVTPAAESSRIPLLVLATTAVIFVVAPILAGLVRGRAPHGLFPVVVLLFIVVPLGLHALGGAVRARRGGTVVTVSPLGIDIDEPGVWHNRTTSIPADDILGLDYGTTTSFIAATTAEARAKWVAAGRSAAEPDPWQRATQGLPAPWWARQLLRLARSRGVLVKGRGGIVAFGAGLPDDEVRYLYALARAALRHEEAKT